MKKSLTVLALAAALAGCAGSGFNIAAKENTKRADDYQLNIITQTTNHLKMVNNCFLSSAGYARVSDTENLLTKIGEPTSNMGCIIMATAFGTQDALLTAFAPFIAKELFMRVPAAPEEIAKDILFKGFEFSLFKYGIDTVRDVVNTGQLAQTQIATQGIEAASKPPLVVEKPVIVTVPAGSAPLPVAAPAVPLTP